jgi:hypothetical protein
MEPKLGLYILLFALCIQHNELHEVKFQVLNTSCLFNAHVHEYLCIIHIHMCSTCKKENKPLKHTCIQLVIKI